MTETAVGFVLLGAALLVVLGVVFVLASRGGGGGGGGGGDGRRTSAPPPGVHMPGPSLLPVVLSVGGALIGAGLAFRAEGQLANPFLAIPGLLVFVGGAVAWVRAANHEWRDVEHGTHDDGASH